MAITAQEQDRLAGALTEIRPHLNERQWRFLLGAQARAVGRGGIKLVARLLCHDHHTTTLGCCLSQTGPIGARVLSQHGSVSGRALPGMVYHLAV